MKAEPLDFTIEQEEALPPNIKTAVEKVTSSKLSQNQVVPAAGRSYLIVTLGERPTAGYTVHIQKVEQQGNALHVYVKEKPPAKGAMVIQVISYPYTVVSINGTYTENDVIFNVDHADNTD